MTTFAKSLLFSIALFFGTISVNQARAVDGSQLLTRCELMLREMHIGTEAGINVSTGGMPCYFFMDAMQGLLAVSDALGVCAPDGTKLTQLVRIFVQYAQQNPGVLNKRAAQVALMAFQQTYPCR
jgi:Rap1a immunity proteins